MDILKRFYRYLGKLVVLDVTNLFVLDLDRFLSHATNRAGIDGYDIRELSASDLQHVADSPGYSISREDVRKLEDGDQFCVGATNEAGLVSYVWFARNSIDASDNRGEHPDSGVGLSLPQQTLFMYNGFTHADYRGQNIVGAIVQYAAERGRCAGVAHFVTTSDWTNQPAHRALRKCLFEAVGCIWRVAGMGVDITRLPQSADRLGVTVRA